MTGGYGRAQVEQKDPGGTCLRRKFIHGVSSLNADAEHGRIDCLGEILVDVGDDGHIKVAMWG